MRTRAIDVFSALVCLAALFCMISSQSFWIDECGSARFACAPSWKVFFELMRTDMSSDSQMPLFMLLSRVWCLLAGRAEYALRCINILFGLVSLLGAYCVSKRLRVAPWLMIGLMFVHPFFWAYMDELRPYAMQIAGGWVILLSVLMIRDSSAPDWRAAAVLLAGSLLLAGSSLLGAVPLLVYGLLVMLLLFRKMKRCHFGFWVVSGVAVAVVGALGLFYIGKLLAGGGGSRSWNPGIGNVVFSIYELIGFSGLGPGRSELRSAASEGAIPGLVIRYVPALAILGMTVLVVFWDGIRNRLALGKDWFIAIGIIVSGFVVMFALAIVFDWPFWGRHLAPFFPALVVAVLLPIQRMLNSRTKAGVIISGILFILLGVSSINIRFSDRFAKDDYRRTYAIAKPYIESGEIVWWAANTESAFYYGVTASPLDPLPINMVPIINASEEELNELPAPRLIVLSKPELYDAKRGIRSFLTHQQAAIVDSYSVFKVFSASTIVEKPTGSE